MTLQTTEKDDLRELHQECAILRNHAFGAMARSQKMSTSELKDSGYKTINDAVVGMFNFYQKKIETLTKEFLKKYPDSGIRS